MTYHLHKVRNKEVLGGNKNHEAKMSLIKPENKTIRSLSRSLCCQKKVAYYAAVLTHSVMLSEQIAFHAAALTHIV